MGRPLDERRQRNYLDHAAALTQGLGRRLARPRQRRLLLRPLDRAALPAEHRGSHNRPPDRQRQRHRQLAEYVLSAHAGPQRHLLRRQQCDDDGRPAADLVQPRRAADRQVEGLLRPVTASTRRFIQSSKISVDVLQSDQGLTRVDVTPMSASRSRSWPFLTVNSSVGWRDTYWTESIDPSTGKQIASSIARQFFDFQARHHRADRSIGSSTPRAAATPRSSST